jgi:hypothetical protein
VTKHLLKVFFLLTFLSAFVYTSAHAQVDAARLTGSILDPTGAAIPSAEIVLLNKTTGVKQTTKSDAKGEYSFLGIPAGSYTEIVNASGFGEFKSGVVLTVGANSVLDAKLGTASSAVTVEVQAADSAVQVNTSTPEISSVIDPKEMVDLPSLSRNPYDFATLSPFATSDPGGSTSRGVGVSFSGQRAAGTEVLLDGVENEDNYDATVGLNIPLDSVEEYRVITNGFDAQYGRASGGIVNLITKGGTNTLHGSLYEFNRISALASNTYYEDATAAATGVPVTKDHFTRNQFGYSIGGPILKDKLFFFSNTEWTRIRSAGAQVYEIANPAFIATSSASTQAFFAQYGALDPATKILSTVGAPSTKASDPTFAVDPLALVTKTGNINAGAGDPQNTWSTLNRFDYALNSKVSMYFRAADVSQVFPAGYVSFSPYKGFDTGENVFNQAYLYNLTYQIKPSLLSNSKVSFSRQNLQEPLNGAPTPSLYLDQANVASADPNTNQTIVLPGYSPTTPGNSIPFGGPANTYQFDETLTWVKKSHIITVGGTFWQLRDNRTFGAYEEAVEQVAKLGKQINSAGTVSYDFNNALQQLQLGNLYSYEVALNPQGKFPCSNNQTANAAGSYLNQTSACTINFPATQPSFERENTFNDGDWFVADSWKVSPHLTLSYGLRWEYYGIQHNHDPNLESNFYPGAGATLPAQVAAGQALTTPNSPTHGLVAQKFTNFAPRIGAAWDPFGNGKWSIRGGFGISYERNFGNVTYNVIQNPPNYATVQLTTNAATQYTIQTSNLGPFAASSGTAALPPSSLRALDPHMPTAYTENWLFSVQHQLTPHDLISLDYSGAHGVHQYSIVGLNGLGYGIYTTGDANESDYSGDRLNHQYGGINQRAANGTSEYDGLNVGFADHNLQRYGLDLTVNYTWSHALDNLSSTFSESGNNFNLGYLNPFNPSLDWGNADYDVRHRVSIGGVYEPTFLQFTSHPLVHALAGGLEFAPIAVLRSGNHFTIYDSTNGLNAAPRLAVVPDQKYTGHVGANQFNNGGSANSFNYLNIAADAANPFTNVEGFSDFPSTYGGYQYAGAGRNQAVGPANVQFDMGVYKNFRAIHDRYDVQLRGEFYNILNHSNYYAVVGTADYFTLSQSGTYNVNVEKGTPGGGSPGSTDERRNVQLAVRVQF